MKKIFIAATFDTKSQEANYIKGIIQELKLPIVSVDLATLHPENSDADIKAHEIASHHPNGSQSIFCGDRGKAVLAMTEAFQIFIKTRQDIGAIIGIGGSGGTSIIAKGMQELPIGIPKILLSTMASGDVGSFVGSSDIAIMYSVTDFVGVNNISSQILANAAGAIAGAYIQAQKPRESIKSLPAIGITMFGVTTSCVENIHQELKKQFDCLVFHATGAGGKSMEKLLDHGLLQGIIDITTTEVCDYLCGGILACDEDRFGALIRSAKPAVVSCGALDMINFGSFDSVPERYRQRKLYKHNSSVTLLRTNTTENIKIGEWIANKLNQCPGEIRFLMPLGGLSALDKPGQCFYDPAANQALFTAIEENLQITTKHKLIKSTHHINSPEFAQLVIQNFIEINAKQITQHHEELEC